MAKQLQHRNAITLGGSGQRALVFGHGYGLDQTSWRYITPFFEHAFRTITFDYVGSGSSDRSACAEPRYTTLDAHALDILDVLDAAGVAECDFIGASISGMLGMLAALHSPHRFKRLVMIGSSAHYINDPPHYHGGFEPKDVDGFLALMNDNFIGWAASLAGIAIKEDPARAQELEAGICAIDPRLARLTAELSFRCDFRGVVQMCRVPTLIVQCTRDDVVPMSAAQYLAKRMPNATLKTLDVSGHCPQLTHPKQLSMLIRHWLESPGLKT